MSVVAQSSVLPLAGPSTAGSRRAFLVKFPENVWNQILVARNDGLTMTMSGSSLSLNLSGQSVQFDANPTGGPTEVYSIQDSLQPLATASIRLNVPYRAPLKGDQPLARSASSPGMMTVIPLKTRVVQSLALGEASVMEIAARTGGAEGDVGRIVKVVGRQVGENPPRYSLQPAQYSKIKVAGWKYTAEEQKRVVELARKAFDELGLSGDAPERMELEKKQEPTAESSPSEDPVVTPDPVPLPSPATSQVKGATSGKAKGLAAREMAKFRAERASSVPTAKGPRVASVKTPDKPAKAKRKRDSPDFTSSEDERSLRQKSPPQPPVLVQNGSEDPEAMRDRYEELYPAYQQLSAKLVNLYHSAEGAEQGVEDGLTCQAELERMVKKWEKWHAELAAIRTRFT